MTCRGEHAKQAELLARASRIAGGQVNGATFCAQEGCGAPLNREGACVRPHAPAPPAPNSSSSGSGTPDFATIVRTSATGPVQRLDQGKASAEVVSYVGDGRGVRKPLQSAQDEVTGRYHHDGNSEVAAYRLGRLLGVEIVPDTVFDGDGSRTTQRFIENGVLGSRASPRSQRQVLHKQEERLYALLALDIILGNPDRHLGNYIYDERGHVWAIDHGHSTWLPFGEPPLGVLPLAHSYPLLHFLGLAPPPEDSGGQALVPHGALRFPPDLVARWSCITHDQFTAAFQGIAQTGRVRLENGWRNLRYIVEHRGIITW